MVLLNKSKLRILFFALAFAMGAAQGSSGLAAGADFRGQCDAKNKSSDDCLDCKFMESDAALERAYQQPLTSRDCRYSEVLFKRNTRGNFDVVGRSTRSGGNELLTFTKTFPEIAGDFHYDTAIAQKSLETKGSELYNRAKFAIWGSRVKVTQVLQSKKPTSPVNLSDVAQITVRYQLSDLDADRIYTALDKVNYVNANSPIGKIFRPIVEAAIGGANVVTRKVNACLLRKTKNQFVSLYGQAKKKLPAAGEREARFFCLDNDKKSCGDCFYDQSNNLKDLAYQIVQPDNETMRSIEEALTKVLVLTKPNANPKSLNRPQDDDAPATEER